MTMASVALLLLQLLLLTPLVSAAHHWGGIMNFDYKGRNSDGSFKMILRGKDTYDLCSYYHSWSCYTGNCGSVTSRKLITIDTSTNTPSYESQWCETENIETWRVPSDKPFQLRVASCCWITTRNGVSDWRLEALVDLGRRSDTGEPNRSPDIAVLPFIRVPQNCPRTYKLAAFDADGDRVVCRYGNLAGIECDSCSLPPGFNLDSNTCTLSYQSTSVNTNIFGFEMVVEDFPRNSINLFYSDGSSTRKDPPLSRAKRGFYTPQSYTDSPTTPPWWGWWQSQTPPAETLTSAVPNTVWWWNTPPPPTTAGYNVSGRPAILPQSKTTSPISKLPLQFAFLVEEKLVGERVEAVIHVKPGEINKTYRGVDPVAPSCQEGVYLPQLVAPTPADGERITAEVHKEVEIRVRAQATHSSIQSLVVSGPANITKHRDTNNEFVLRWTPVLDDLGEYYPVCFAVESVSGSSDYQSEMRCVLIEVRKEQIEATVTCTESTMKVEVDKASFFGLNEDHLHLNDPSNTICSLDRHSNSTHIVAIIPLNDCGTQIEEDDDYLIFKNEITTLEDDPNELITRKHLVEARFYCQYPKRGNVTLSFSAHRKNVTVWEKGFGTFTYQFEFYQDDQFEAVYDPNSYPLEFDIGKRIYMQLDASSSVNNTEMFVESCRAAPYDNPNYHPTYSIIENGCAVDPTVETYSASNDRQFPFSMEAFKFIGLHDQVYISCTVMMCEAGNPNTRCSQGCINSTRSNSFRRSKRDAVVESGKHFVSQGPLRLKREADPRGGSAFNLNLNLMFVAGCLLVAVGMVCGVLIYKAKASRVKYQPLPAYEN